MPFISSITSGRFGGGKGVDRFPVWSTAAGQLGAAISDLSRSGQTRNVLASDPDGTTVRYVIVSGSLPPGMSLSETTGAITGTPNAVVTDTTYTFTIRALSGVFQTTTPP
jgi:hypothetical protein